VVNPTSDSPAALSHHEEPEEHEEGKFRTLHSPHEIGWRREAEVLYADGEWLFEPQRGGGNIAQGNALGLEQLRWFAPCKGNGNAHSLCPFWAAKIRGGGVSQGVALGYSPRPRWGEKPSMTFMRFMVDHGNSTLLDVER